MTSTPGHGYTAVDRRYCPGRAREVPLDTTVIRKLVNEISPRIAGAKIASSSLAARDCLVLELLADERLFLVVSTMRAMPLVFLTDSPDDVPPPRAELEAGPERDLRNGRISSLRVAGADDLLEFLAVRTDSAGRTVERILAVDLGRRPGISVRDVARRKSALEDDGGPDGPSDAQTVAAAGAVTVSWRHDRSERLHVRVRMDDEGASADADDRFEGSSTLDSANEAARFAFVRFWDDLDHERRRGDVRRAIAAVVRRKRRAAGKVQREVDDATRAAEYRAKGQLILARKDSIPRGRTPVEVLDFDNETKVVIDVDPRLDPQRNAETLFRKAKKAERRGERAPARLDEIETEMRELEELEASIAEASDEELTGLEERFLRPTIGRARAKTQAERARYRTYTVSGGWQVLVGKSNRDNDVLSHRIARPDDLWFHARQTAGSHVVLRRAGRKEQPDRRAILETAAIAAYHSKAGKSSKVSVCYTEKRHVRKPRGARPGLAVVSREKVVMVEPKLPET